MSARIWIRRAYALPTRGDGYRVLVDRVWPRGVRKEEAALDDWMREVAPSTDLRHWFGHDPARFEEFRSRYHRELADRTDAVEVLTQRVREGRLTLVYGARDEQHNNAIVLREHLEGRR